MLATDRALYSREDPYADSPQSIGGNWLWCHPELCAAVVSVLHLCVWFVPTGYRATISAPHMVSNSGLFSCAEGSDEHPRMCFMTASSHRPGVTARSRSRAAQRQVNRRRVGTGCGIRERISDRLLCEDGEFPWWENEDRKPREILLGRNSRVSVCGADGAERSSGWN